MICMQQVTIEPHARVVCCKLWYQMVCFYVFRFLYVACMQPLSCGRDIFVAYEKRISLAPQADEQTRHMHRYTHTSINIWRYGIFYIQINVCIVVFRFRFMEVGLEGYLDMLLLCAWCISICILKHTSRKCHITLIYSYYWLRNSVYKTVMYA